MTTSWRSAVSEEGGVDSFAAPGAEDDEPAEGSSPLDVRYRWDVSAGEVYWERVRWSTRFTNMMLRPPPHVGAMFDAAARLPAFADVGYDNTFTTSLPEETDDVGRGGTDDTIFGGPHNDNIDAGAGDFQREGILVVRLRR